MLCCRYGQTVAAGQEGDIMFVPQKPYMVLGSLREQVLYPTWATSDSHQQSEGSEHADRCVPPHHLQCMSRILTAVPARCLVKEQREQVSRFPSCTISGVYWRLFCSCLSPAVCHNMFSPEEIAFGVLILIPPGQGLG